MNTAHDPTNHDSTSEPSEGREKLGVFLTNE